MTPTEQPQPTIAERIAANFSFINSSQRLGRGVTGILGYFMGLGKPPIHYSFTEWCGLGVVIAGAIWTSATPERREL